MMVSIRGVTQPNKGPNQTKVNQKKEIDRALEEKTFGQFCL